MNTYTFPNPKKPFEDTATMSILPAGAQNGTILVIDDESQVRQIAVRMIERLGYHALDAENSSEGIDILSREASTICCVLLDWSMAGQSGVTTVQELRALHPTLPVIVMSGYNALDIDRQIGRPSIDGFLQKPFRMDDLRVALEHVRQRKLIQTPAYLGQTKNQK
ncbi:response regulator [Candidatus Gracilibacteria bacterium]|nr:response regulator [Candidatus Gracilibacteria bacterium]